MLGTNTCNSMICTCGEEHRPILMSSGAVSLCGTFPVKSSKFLDILLEMCPSRTCHLGILQVIVCIRGSNIPAVYQFRSSVITYRCLLTSYGGVVKWEIELADSWLLPGCEIELLGCIDVCAFVRVVISMWVCEWTCEVMCIMSIYVYKCSAAQDYLFLVFSVLMNKWMGVSVRVCRVFMYYWCSLFYLFNLLFLSFPSFFLLLVFFPLVRLSVLSPLLFFCPFISFLLLLFCFSNMLSFFLSLSHSHTHHIQSKEYVQQMLLQCLDLDNVRGLP